MKFFIYFLGHEKMEILGDDKLFRKILISAFLVTVEIILGENYET